MDHFFAPWMLPNAEKDGSNEVYCSVIWVNAWGKSFSFSYWKS